MIAIVSLIIGFILLSWGADRLVTGAAALARNLHVPPLLIGLTIVALGTSAPEIVVSITAAIQGTPKLAIGNALGSNIANIGLVLGFAALLMPMRVQSRILRREYPVLFLIMLLSWLLLMDGNLSRFDGIVLLVGLSLLMAWLIYLGLRSDKTEPLDKEYQQEIPKSMPNSLAITWLLIGLILLPLGSEILVKGAIDIAKAFGISELTIGLTIVAIGTSLPEMAASIAGAFKKEYDISIGNIIGSNMFNLLAVLPFPGLIAPSTLSKDILSRDMPVMFAMTIVLFLVAYGRNKPGHITRLEGALLLAAYTGYLIMIVRS